MAFAPPDRREVAELGDNLGLRLSETETSQYQTFLQSMAPAMRLIEMLPELPVENRYPRVPGYRPEGAGNPFNAWAWRSEIRGAADGALTGMRVAIKDCIAVAGVPMSNGASVLEGFVPDEDATVVTRILDAGGTILGKSACEYMCFAGNSATSATGPVENPNAPGCTTGGSSNGSAALVAAREVDLALGADQAGSIRMPASFCGIVGLKPTFGLVPYTGALPIDPSFDHVGPLTRTVEDCARLLEVIAGPDGRDERQTGLPTQPYREMLDRSVKGLRIGVIAEGFARAESEEGVDDCVRDALAALVTAGAQVESASMPWHLHGAAIWLGVGLEGPYHGMVRAHGVGYGLGSGYSLGHMRAGAAWRSHGKELPPTIKAVLLAGAVLERSGGRIYAKARNLGRRLRHEYDALLDRFDVLVMPTTPMTATRLIHEDTPVPELLDISWKAMGNTSPTNLTGHPAISVPCGHLRGKPVGLMIIGRHNQDGRVLGVAQAVETLRPSA